jgi:uncharacterized protein (TIGR02246 family)
LLRILHHAVINYAQFSRDNEDVIRVANAYFKSWNRHDFSDLSEYATEDMNFVIGPGVLWKGRNQVQSGHQNGHKSVLKNTSFTPDEQSISIRFITADVAVVNISAKMGARYPPDEVDRVNNKQGENKFLLTIVEIKKDGKWLITAAQGTKVDPQAEAILQQN